MEITWKNLGPASSMKSFLLHHGVSMRLIKSIKHGTGSFLLDQMPVKGVITVPTNSVAGIQLPPEQADPEVAVSNEPVSVIAEDQNWLVVNKAAGINSVPGPSNRSDTLVNQVKGYLVQEQAENLRPHLVSRLDRYTSGIVVVAKHRLAQSAAMQASSTKIYLAVVAGHLDEKHGMINLPIGRQGDNPQRVVLQDGQPASTEYWVLAELPNATVVKVQLHTGRTHQIRVHFTALGHPLLGDQLYGGPLDAGIDRQALHAWTFSMTDPLTMIEQSWQAPFPADLLAILPEQFQSEG